MRSSLVVASTFKPKPCERCGDTFTPTGPGAKYCDVCGPEVRRERDRERRSNLMRDPAYRERRREYDRKRCVDRNRARRRDPAYRERERRRARELRRERRRERFCKRCGARFDPKWSREAYCSNECRSEATKEKQRKRYHERPEEWKRAERARNKERSRAKRREAGVALLDEPRPCEECGAMFLASGPGQKTCSKECRLASRQRYSRAWYHRRRADPGFIERQREYNRRRSRRKKAASGQLLARCYLCGGHIEADKQHDEHVLPLARFGGEEGFRELLAPACGPCNYMKGTKTISELVTERDARIKNLEEQLDLVMERKGKDTIRIRRRTSADNREGVWV